MSFILYHSCFNANYNVPLCHSEHFIRYLKNFFVNNVFGVTTLVIDIHCNCFRISHSAKCYIQLSMCKYMIRQIYANKVQSLSLCLVCRHCKTWPNRELSSFNVNGNSVSEGAMVILGSRTHFPLFTPLAISTSNTFSPSVTSTCICNTALPYTSYFLIYIQSPSLCHQMETIGHT